jgi:hypothetical protein
MWLISARTPYWLEAPRDMVMQLDTHGVLIPHTQYKTVSIRKFIATRWGLPPLDERDRRANDLTRAFEF